MDIGTVSSEDVMASYERQLAEAHQKIAMLEAALTRELRLKAHPVQFVPTQQEDSDGEE